MFQYFYTVVRNSDRYKDIKKKLSKEITLTDTITPGEWVGFLNDVMWKDDSFKITIFQTEPYIIGTFLIDRPANYLEGKIRGRIKDDGFIMVCQLNWPKEHLFFMEGKCFKDISDLHPYPNYEIIGTMKAEYEWWITKGNFRLEKRNH